MSFKHSIAFDGDGPIQIVRDANGVPVVKAQYDTDLYRGLGYCHGADRGLQLIMVKTLAEGRACELLADNDEMLAVDTFFRKMDFGRDAGAEFQRLPDQAKTLMMAYVDGVNRALAASFPWELKLLGLKSARYLPVDPIVLGRVIAFVNLAQSQGDMERLLVEMVQNGVSREHLEELFPGIGSELDTYLLKRVKLGEKTIPDAIRWSTVVPRAMASNNWVLGGKKTASGKAILANDPHLEVNRLPAVWYEVRWQQSDRYFVGATMPGLPALIIGRTNDLAWGVTYAFMDATDSWVEECKDGKFRRFVDGTDTWQAFTERKTTIKRKSNKPVECVFWENNHGVLDGDPHVEGRYLATLWAPTHGTGAASIAAFMGLFRARNVKQGMKLCSHIETGWNWVLADDDGAIGYQMSGRMPARNEGRSGFVPLDGVDPHNDWLGFIPPDRLPWMLDPEEGYFCTANQDLNKHGRCRPINLPMGPYRADRISAQLAARDDWSVSATQRLQTDLVSGHADTFMRVLGPLLPNNKYGHLLAKWDLQYDRSSVEATIFERFYGALTKDVFGSVFGADVVDHMLNDSCIIADFFHNFDAVLLSEQSRWYGEEGRDATWKRVAEGALDGPLKPWGETQQIHMRHILFGNKLPGLFGFDKGPFALEGCRGTIQQGQVYKSGGRQTSFAASYRFVTDFGESGAHTCLAGGPSDRRFSRWYASDVDRWLNGNLKKVDVPEVT
jgi:penicillin G amidase